MANLRTYKQDIEQLVQAYGYSVEVVKRLRDTGVDAIARRGQRVVAIQCKLYQGPVGSKSVQLLLDSKSPHGATDFVFITTGKFTNDALALARRAEVRVIGREEVLLRCQEEGLVLRSASYLQTPRLSYPLRGREYVIGSDDSCPIHLRDAHVSGRHAVLRRYGPRLSIIDLGSAEGTFLNGRRIEQGAQYWLRYGDELVFGSVRCELSMLKGQPVRPNLRHLASRRGERGRGLEQ